MGNGGEVVRWGNGEVGRLGGGKLGRLGSWGGWEVGEVGKLGSWGGGEGRGAKISRSNCYSETEIRLK